MSTPMTTPMSTHRNHSHQKQWLMIAGAIALLMAVLAYNGARMSTNQQRPLPPAQQETAGASVDVIEVSSGRYQATVTAYGSAEARYQLTLAAQVSAEVTTLTPKLEIGEQVQQGEVLLQLDDRDYQAALANAQSDLASARVSLLEEEREGAQALAEWQSAGLEGEPDSELVFRRPQLAAARATLNQAEAALSSAQRDLENTQVKAPFSALVVERLVAPGSLVQVGTELATLYSSDSVEITLELSPQQWQSLPQASNRQWLAEPWPVTLTAVNGNGQWQGQVLRQSLNLDAETRQRALVVSVASPLEHTPALLPGTFVEASLPGEARAGLWKLPPAALSQRSEIWYVTQENTLASFAAQIAFSDKTAIYVQPPENLSESVQRVLVHPLNSYLQGMRVTPRSSQTPLISQAEAGASDE